MKDPIDYGALDPQQRLDVARGVDDSALLRVVAWVASTKHPQAGKQSAIFEDKESAERWAEHWRQVCKLDAPVTELCRLTDAQALIAELREELEQAVANDRSKAGSMKAMGAEIAALQRAVKNRDKLKARAEAERDALRSHIRTDNSETLVNALKEIERLKAQVRLRELALSAVDQVAGAEIASLRDQLEKLQAAPAERWMVFNVGCIECGVSSDVVGMYAAKEEAQSVAEACDKELSWREGGQNSFEVFDMQAKQASEYSEVIARLNPAPATAEQPECIVCQGTGSFPFDSPCPACTKPATAEQVWQPIETAPKNERILIARAGHPRVFVAKWCEQYSHWSCGPSAMGYFAAPTHWMRHCEPPATADSDVREVK